MTRVSYVGFYIGPKEEKNIIEWCFTLKLIDTQTLLKYIKNTEEYKDFTCINDEIFDDPEEDITLLIDWTDTYIDYLYNIFDEKLTSLNLTWVCSGTISQETFRIGRNILNLNEDITDDVKFWEQYSLKADIFPGLDNGQIDLLCQFPQKYYPN